MAGYGGGGKKKLPDLDPSDLTMPGKSVLAKLFTGSPLSKASANEAGPEGKNRFGSGSPDIKSSKLKEPRGPEKGKMGTEYRARKPSSSEGMSKPSRKVGTGLSDADRARKAAGYSSGSIDNRKPNADLGAFYLNATSGMDSIFKRGKKK